jgi:hypothetical protein
MVRSESEIRRKVKELLAEAEENDWMTTLGGNTHQTDSILATLKWVLGE